MHSKWYHHGLLIIQHAEDLVIYTCDFCGREWKHKLIFRKHKNCAGNQGKELTIENNCEGDK